MTVDVLRAVLAAIAAAFLCGVCVGLVIAWQWGRYCDANRRGGDLDLTGRRP